MSETQTGLGALVCIPTYNEKENIERIAGAVLEALPGANLLVIDDNSPDGTGVIADAMAANDARIHVLHRERKEGLGKAYLAGFAWALARDFAFIIEFDADFSHDPASLPEMMRRFSQSDVVVGSRRVPGGGSENWTLGRRIVSAAGSTYARTVLGVPIRDLTGGFNGFRREALALLDIGRIATSGYGFQIEIKYRAIKSGLRVVEMPIIFRDRKAGSSKMSSAIFFEAMLNVLRLRFR
jgi:dolichol-phosphate mannosyltransferase